MSVQNQNIETQPSDNNTKLLNTLKGNELIIQDSVTMDLHTFNFSHPKISSEWTFWMKECFVNLCGGWNSSELQSLSARVNTAKGWRNSLLRIGVWATSNSYGTPMSQWDEVKVTEMMIEALNNKIEWTEDRDIAPLGRGPIEQLFTTISKTRNFKTKGELSDGIMFDLPDNFLEEIFKAPLKKYGLTYHEWLSSGGWESIPLPVAMAFLSDAIDMVRSTKTKFLIDYFNFQRTEDRVSTRTIFSHHQFNHFCSTGEYKINRNGAKEKAAKLKEIIEKHYNDASTGFPFKHKEIHDHCDDVYDACMVIYLCLTAIRLSELSSIDADDYDIETDGTWVFKSSLLKTNMGIKESLEMSGLVAEASNTLMALSYVTKRKRKDGKRVPLFSRYLSKSDCGDKLGTRHSMRSEKEHTLRLRLNRFYEKFLEKRPEFKEICESIHPHRFRHTWAEFALRRFEGNVFEAIRRHFRHSYGSYFTTNYVFNKLTDEVREDIEGRYLKEILTRIVTEDLQATLNEDFKRDLVGKVANQVSKAMSSTILTEAEIHQFVEELSDEYESILAHEYGYCIVRKDLKHLAKCVDKKTQTPILKNGCFEICSGCVNFLASEKSNKESITRIAVSHTEMIASFKNIFGDNVTSTAINASKKTVKRAEEILNDMEAKNE